MRTHQAPRHPAPACKNLDAPSKSVGPSLLSGPPFPNLIGEARVDESRRVVIHSIGGPKCPLIELRQQWFSSTRKSMS
ncbi:MAG: hypothetical protein JWQ50_7436 [Caballeronia mineralivorans]|jgi:hypothetical protein|nr:hypothetical protein [Caballeronia mineralivorans]MEA3105297.1 hypothetical protein [Caballeronia mineralivorans]